LRAELGEDDAWYVEGTVSVPPKSGPWQFSPVLKFGTESGSPYAVEWASLDAVSGCDEHEGHLLTHADARSIEFRAVTDPSTHPVASTRARVMVDIRDVRRVGETAQ
jgi:RNA polymerase primary sigma factor